MKRYVVCVFSVLLFLSNSMKAELEEVLPVDDIESAEEEFAKVAKGAGVSTEELEAVVEEVIARAENAGDFWDEDFLKKNKKAIKIGAAVAAGAVIVSGGAWCFWTRGNKKTNEHLGTSFEKRDGKTE